MSRATPRKLTVVAVIVIVALGLPIFSLHLGISDAGLRSSSSSTTRLAYDLLAKGFTPGFNGPLTVVGSIHNGADEAAMKSWTRRSSIKPDIIFVQLWKISILKATSALSRWSQDETWIDADLDLITALRDRYIPDATATSHTADLRRRRDRALNDFSGILDSKIPLFVAIIVILGCLLLMVAFRSILFH